MRMQPWGSYSGWSKCVRAPLVWLGQMDPYGTRHDMETSADDSRADTSAVMEALYQLFGTNPWTVKDLLMQAMSSPGDNGQVMLIEDVMAEILDPKEQRTVSALGYRLGQHKDRWINGLRLTQSRKAANRVWEVLVSPERAGN